MKLLLDTHTLLWWWTDDPQLPDSARALIADEGNEVLVSAASAWEIATKHRLGKLPEAGDAIPRFNELVAADGFLHLPVNYLHSLRAGAYAIDHCDPFDQVLAAQSELESASLVTRDPAFTAFGTRVVW
ncbi:MAG: PilT protein domain protein [bacterium]|nr:MAG: PilT protein domain protein [bacterium]KAF0147347.1 MAG: PilT protein domain protein [bacterium]KAF0165525.1 MAG: PilT protein domain protein [bacterium]TXT17062.1 MAG: PilT protein domain protein [bacterium]